jgi:hypothetical protein
MGFSNFHMARRSADRREEPNPLYAAAATTFVVGIIVGAHNTATIANAMQKKLSIVLQEVMEMEEHEFTMQDWGVFYRVWYIECSSAGVQEVVAKKLKDYEFMLLPDELTAPVDKLNRLQKKAARFVEWAEEKMEVAGLNGDRPKQQARKAYKTACSLSRRPKQQARKAYKTAHPIINAKIDARLLVSFNICDVWEGTTPEQAQEREDEWDAGRGEEELHQELHHGMRRRQALARAMLLSPDEAGAWSDDMKKEANDHAMTPRRILHHFIGEVVVVKHIGEAQAIPEEQLSLAGEL